MLKYNSRLLRDCRTEEEKKARTEFLTAHLPALQLLHSIFKRDMNEVMDRHIQEGYDTVAWAYKQADVNGQVRALTQVLEILSTTEDNHVN